MDPATFAAAIGVAIEAIKGGTKIFEMLQTYQQTGQWTDEQQAALDAETAASKARFAAALARVTDSPVAG